MQVSAGGIFKKQFIDESIVDTGVKAFNQQVGFKAAGGISTLEDAEEFLNDLIDDFKNDESEDVIYVRNTKLNTDYMINKRFGKYSDIVGLGGDSDDD